jgi:hypothetical protein
VKKAPPKELLPRADIKRIWNDPKELRRFTEEKLAADENMPTGWILHRYPMFHALVKKDTATFKRLCAEYPDEAPAAAVMYAEYTRPRPHRRPRLDETIEGGDLSMRRELADLDYIRIQDIWFVYLDKQYRTQYPTAYQIAAERNGLTAEQLKSYRSNRHHRK